MSDMSKVEQTRFVELKNVVKQTAGAFVRCGEALAEIRDRKLYRVQYETFEQFVEKEYNWTRQRAYQMIDAAKTVKTLPPKMSTRVDTEKKARALAKVPEENRKSVVQSAISSGKVTVNSLKKAAEKSTEISRLDKTGYPIPTNLISDWDEADEIAKNLLGKISSVRTEIKGAREEENILYSEVSQHTISDLDSAYAGVSQIAPYAVCTTCQGHAKKHCGLCKGKGFISRFRYTTTVSSETKEIRKANA